MIEWKTLWKKYLEDSGLLFKGVRETIQNEAKEPKRGFLSMLLDASDASLLGHMLTGKGIIRAGYGSEEHQSEKKGIVRAGYGSKRSSIKNF